MKVTPGMLMKTKVQKKDGDREVPVGRQFEGGGLGVEALAAHGEFKNSRFEKKLKTPYHGITREVFENKSSASEEFSIWVQVRGVSKIAMPASARIRVHSVRTLLTTSDS
jgi:hypothetical protein